MEKILNQLLEEQRQLFEGQNKLFREVISLSERQKEINKDIKYLKTEAEANKQFRNIVMETLVGIEDEIVDWIGNT